MQDFICGAVSFRTQLSVWQKAHNLTINVYKLTKNLPAEEKFGLISQIRRCCISIESNLAEGCGRDGDKEFARFVDISMGSSFELRCQLLVARDLGYIDSNQYQLFESKILEINRMLGGLLKKLRA
jgi:four helix bundle protein